MLGNNKIVLANISGAQSIDFWEGDINGAIRA
jgi:hypothetical protein